MPEPGPGRLLARVLRRWPEAGLLLALAMLLTAAANAGFRPQVDGPIRIVAGQLPPQIDHTGNGREARIIEAALRQTYAGKPVAFHILPFSRHWNAFKSQDDEGEERQRYDGVATVPAQLKLDGFPSADYIAYRNGIIYRAADFPQGLDQDHPIESLRNRRVVAFAGAAGILPEVRANVRNFRSYAEYDDQYAHSMLLARGGVDAVIADRTIIAYYNGRVMSAAAAAALRFSPVFCPTPYHMVFRTPEMRDAFNRGLSAIRAAPALVGDDSITDWGLKLQEVPGPQLRCD